MTLKVETTRARSTMRLKACVYIGITLLGLASARHVAAQLPNSDTPHRYVDLSLPIDARIRVRCCESNTWLVGRVSAIAPDSLLLATTSNVVPIQRAKVRELEQSQGRDVGGVVRWATLAAVAGLITGTYAGKHMFGVPSLGNMDTELGGLIGFLGGATIGAALKWSFGSEEWAPAVAPWPSR